MQQSCRAKTSFRPHSKCRSTSQHNGAMKRPLPAGKAPAGRYALVAPMEIPMHMDSSGGETSITPDISTGDTWEAEHGKGILLLSGRERRAGNEGSIPLASILFINRRLRISECRSKTCTQTISAKIQACSRSSVKIFELLCARAREGLFPDTVSKVIQCRGGGPPQSPPQQPPRR